MTYDELADYCKEASKTISELDYKNRILDKENQELKEQNKKEFADYIKFKKEQYDEYLEKINKLIKENQKLKKQLKDVLNENRKLRKNLENCMTFEEYEYTLHKKVQLRNQQKEFIKYLKGKIKYFKDLEQFAIKVFNNKAVINLDLVKISIDEDRIVIENLEEALQKYKEIIGVSDEKEN